MQDSGEGTDETTTGTRFKVEQPGVTDGVVHEPIRPDPEVWERAKLPQPDWVGKVPDWFYHMMQDAHRVGTLNGSPREIYAIFDSNGNFQKFVYSWNAAKNALSPWPNGCCVRYDPVGDKCTVYGGKSVGYSTAGQGSFQAQVNQFMGALLTYERGSQDQAIAIKSINDYYKQLEMYTEYLRSQEDTSGSSDDSGSSDSEHKEEGDGSVPASEPTRGGLYEEPEDTQPDDDSYHGGWGGPNS